MLVECVFEAVNFFFFFLILENGFQNNRISKKALQWYTYIMYVNCIL